MLEIVERNLAKIRSLLSRVSAATGAQNAKGNTSSSAHTGGSKTENKTVSDSESEKSGRKSMKVIKRGPAMRVIFFYPGEEGTYVDHANVTLYENGIVHIDSNQEETTTHLQNCEILWRFETDADERANKVRLLKPKAVEPQLAPESSDESPISTQPLKGVPRSPETVE